MDRTREYREYRIKHNKYGGITVKADSRLLAIQLAAKAWKAPWTSIARDCKVCFPDEKQGEGNG